MKQVYFYDQNGTQMQTHTETFADGGQLYYGDKPIGHVDDYRSAGWDVKTHEGVQLTLNVPEKVGEKIREWIREGVVQCDELQRVILDDAAFERITTYEKSKQDGKEKKTETSPSERDGRGHHEGTNSPRQDDPPMGDQV